MFLSKFSKDNVKNSQELIEYIPLFMKHLEYGRVIPAFFLVLELYKDNKAYLLDPS